MRMTIRYQKKNVYLDIPVPEKTIDVSELAGRASDLLLFNFEKYMKKKGIELTKKSKEKYRISQYVLIKIKLVAWLENKNRGTA